VLLGRANVDDVNVKNIAATGSLDAVVAEYLAEYQKVRALGGLYILSYHSQLLSRPELVPALARIARRIRADSAVWLTTAGEVVSWWRSRAALDVSASMTDARTFTVVASNTGTSTVTGAQVRVFLPEGRSATGTVRTLKADPGVLRFALPELGPGARRVFRFSLR
jgi:uncharacterized repeat protein (TIGR01451 family)